LTEREIAGFPGVGKKYERKIQGKGRALKQQPDGKRGVKRGEGFQKNQPPGNTASSPSMKKAAQRKRGGRKYNHPSTCCGKKLNGGGEKETEKTTIKPRGKKNANQEAPQ